MLRRTHVVSPALALACALVSSAASAQDATTNVLKKDVTDVKVEPVPEVPEGLIASIRGDATLSFTDTQRVIGQTDGNTINMGVKVDARADWIRGDHEWRNSVLLNAGVTRTPTIPEFIKNTDALQFESIYLYHLTPWFGPFARFRLDTAMFPGTDIRPGATNYKIRAQDGTITETCPPTTDPNAPPCTTTKLPLTDGFQPLTLKESLGVFAQPYKTEPLAVEVRLGGGAQQILANNQYAVTDVADDPTNCPSALDPTQRSPIPCVEISQLSDVIQAGLEANLELWGTVYEKKITYKAYAGVLIPFAHGDLPQSYFDQGGKDDVGELTNIDLGVNVSFKIVEWATLGYELKAVRVPQLLPDTFQVRNSLFFTLGYGADNKPPPPPEPAPAPAPAPAAPAPVAPAPAQ